MKNKILAATMFGAVLAVGFAPAYSFADNSVGEKAEEAVNDTGRAVKKGARTVKDKSCELVNGKMECAGKKIKSKAKNAVDSAEDAID